MQSFICQFQTYRSDKANNDQRKSQKPMKFGNESLLPLFSESRTEQISTSRHKTLTLLSCGVTWWAAFGVTGAAASIGLQVPRRLFFQDQKVQTALFFFCDSSWRLSTGRLRSEQCSPSQ
jgi:hypothetical protein